MIASVVVVVVAVLDLQSQVLLDELGQRQVAVDERLDQRFADCEDSVDWVDARMGEWILVQQQVQNVAAQVQVAWLAGH